MLLKLFKKRSYVNYFTTFVETNNHFSFSSSFSDLIVLYVISQSDELLARVGLVPTMLWMIIQLYRLVSASTFKLLWLQSSSSHETLFSYKTIGSIYIFTIVNKERKVPLTSIAVTVAKLEPQLSHVVLLYLLSVLLTRMT